MGVLENRDQLIAALRDPITKTWWDFRYRGSCALGMIDRMRPNHGNSIDDVADYLGLTRKQAFRIFGIYPFVTLFRYGRLRRSKVTPEMVADVLENI